MICCAAFTFFLTTSETFAAPDSVFFVDAPVAVAVAGGIIGGIVSLCLGAIRQSFLLVFVYCFFTLKLFFLRGVGREVGGDS
ncbi:unnamed protein product [Durusdinium trenchii]|uniref:Uncharacterized protein n=1 Tax=Durusdinium trenchii TaxID=1381693 RepID=A0ABP0STL1_9DINO